MWKNKYVTKWHSHGHKWRNLDKCCHGNHFIQYYVLLMEVDRMCVSSVGFQTMQHCDLTAIASTMHDDVIKWKHFPRSWPFVRRIHRSPVNSQHKDQWRGALMFALICVWINGWVNNREAGDLRRHRGHYDVIVMGKVITSNSLLWDVIIYAVPIYLFLTPKSPIKTIQFVQWPT